MSPAAVDALKSKYILPAFLCAICVSAADADDRDGGWDFGRELQQCEAVHKKLAQATNDVLSLRADSPRAYGCLTEINGELDVATHVTGRIVNLVRMLPPARTDRLSDLARKTAGLDEKLLSLHLRDVKLDSCLATRDDRVPPIVQNAFHLVRDAIDCAAAVKAKFSAAK
jgi:hypothetical protein